MAYMSCLEPIFTFESYNTQWPSQKGSRMAYLSVMFRTNIDILQQSHLKGSSLCILNVFSVNFCSYVKPNIAITDDGYLLDHLSYFLHLFMTSECYVSLFAERIDK